MKRRQQQAAKTAADMRSSLGEGDQIVTIGGLYGTVVGLDDESVTLEISPGVTARYDRNAIAKVIVDADAEAEPDDEDDPSIATDTDLETTANSIIETKD